MQTLTRAIIPLFILLTAAAIWVDWATLVGDERLTRERGSVETMSCIGYLAATALYLMRAGRHSFWPVPVALILMALREFDADKRFTSEGILSTKIFIRDTALWEKGLAALVWIVVLWTAASLIRHRGRLFLSALRRVHVWALATSAGLFLAAFSKTIDGLGRKLAPMGIDIGSGAATNAAVLEEGLELFIPILFMAAILLKSFRQAD